MQRKEYFELLREINQRFTVLEQTAKAAASVSPLNKSREFAKILMEYQLKKAAIEGLALALTIHRRQGACGELHAIGAASPMHSPA